MTQPQTIIVTCNLAEGSVERVREKLVSAGFQIEHVLEFAGSIVGTWNKSLEELQSIDEVDAVELSEMKHPQQDQDPEDISEHVPDKK